MNSILPSYLISVFLVLLMVLLVSQSLGKVGELVILPKENLSVVIN